MLSGYRLIKSLGQGGFGNVILAEEEISGRKVAIKTLKNIAEDKIDSIIHEIKIISQFYHPHIVTYHNSIIEDENIHLVMEYCEKGNLSDLIKSRSLNQNEVIDIVLSIAKALKHVHDKGIVHHDVKPANILMADNGQVKLADFGVANTTGFTRLYVPPINKDFQNYKTDFRLDIYALGITFIELINGNHPFSLLSREQIIDKLQKGDLGISHLPEWIQEIIIKATNLNENYRFQKIDEFIEAVETNNIPVVIDNKHLLAAQKAKRFSGLLHRKKYLTIRLEIEQIKRLREELLAYPVLIHQIGNFHIALNDIGNAHECFEVIKDKMPSININKQLGLINLELGKYAKAISLLSEHLSCVPDDCEAYNLLLECYFKNKRFSTGHNLCKNLIAVFPDEMCFKTNQYLFEKLSNKNTLVIDRRYLNSNNLFILYNQDIFNSGNSILKSPDELYDKLLFCHFQISHANSANKDLEILINDVPFQEFYPFEFITMGRKGFGNIIEFEGNSISRKHCVLLALKNENWLYDMNSTGTYVDGQRIKGKLKLTHKHEIKIGNNSIIINVDKTKLF